jgi:hypothetical protein
MIEKWGLLDNPQKKKTYKNLKQTRFLVAIGPHHGCSVAIEKKRF